MQDLKKRIETTLERAKVGYACQAYNAMVGIIKQLTEREAKLVTALKATYRAMDEEPPETDEWWEAFTMAEVTLTELGIETIEE